MSENRRRVGVGDVLLLPPDREGGPTIRAQVESVPGDGQRWPSQGGTDYVLRLSAGLYQVTNHPWDYDQVPYVEWTCEERIRSLMNRGAQDFVWDPNEDGAEDRALEEWHQRVAFELAGFDPNGDEDWMSWSEAMIRAGSRIDDLLTEVQSLRDRVSDLAAEVVA